GRRLWRAAGRGSPGERSSAASVVIRAPWRRPVDAAPDVAADAGATATSAGAGSQPARAAALGAGAWNRGDPCGGRRARSAHDRRGLDARGVARPAAWIGVERLLPWPLLPSAAGDAWRERDDARRAAATRQRGFGAGGTALPARSDRELRARTGAAGGLRARRLELRERSALAGAGEAWNALRLPAREQSSAGEAGCTVSDCAQGEAACASARVAALALVPEPALAEATARDP